MGEHFRRRPNTIRYVYIAVSDTNIHTGATLGGLKRTPTVNELYLADLHTGHVGIVTASLSQFLAMWALNYNNPDWDYFNEVQKHKEGSTNGKVE